MNNKILHIAVFIVFTAFNISNSLSQTTANANVIVSSPAPTKENNVSAPAAIKDAVIESKLFDKPLFEGKAGISLFTEDTVSGKNAYTPANT